MTGHVLLTALEVESAEPHCPQGGPPAGNLTVFGGVGRERRKADLIQTGDRLGRTWAGYRTALQVINRQFNKL